MYILPRNRGEEALLKELLPVKKSSFINNVRNFFLEKGFVEVSTPSLSPYPGLDPNIEPIRIEYSGEILFLHTSPELSMKKILAKSNLTKIFQVCRVFRKEPFIDELHNIEFDLVEFYVKEEDYRTLIKIAMELLLFLSEIYGKRELKYKESKAIIDGSFEIVSLEELTKSILGKSIKDVVEEEFWKIFVTHIEPIIRQKKKPTFVIDWPHFSSIMSREKNDKKWLIERVELFLAGVEVMNGNTENVDPVKQLNRMLKEAKKRFGEDYEKYIDKEFIELIPNLGLTSGAAIGVDRLLMLFEGLENITSTFNI
ncbi:MAG: amino acid--tRNA ligase-related protein [Thermosulfidibacteraceae bacterium]|jgi:elongation factor P--beta-lysine ligase